MIRRVVLAPAGPSLMAARRIEVRSSGLVGPPGPAGAPGPDTAGALSALTDHVESITPHIEATSGRDFAALFTNGLI